MAYNPDKHHRKSIRLKDWDYTTPGAYFITICVLHREHLLGKIINGKMNLNNFGEIVRDTWQWLANQYPYVTLDEYAIMPNHFHGILWICKDGTSIAPIPSSDPRKGGSRTAPVITDETTHVPDDDPPMDGKTPTHDPRKGGSRTAPANASAITGDIRTAPADMKIKPIGRLIGAFKTVSTKHINIQRKSIGAVVWQRDFYEHIGRNDTDLFRIRNYIRRNPVNWKTDDENSIQKSPRYVAMPNPQKQYI